MRAVWLVGVLLVGCAATPMVWEKPGGSAEEFERDKAQCEFEAIKAVQNVDYTYQTIVGQEMDKAYRRRDVGVACLKAKGYTLRQ